MPTLSEKNAYLLLFRSTDWHRDLSPQEIQETMSRWMAWFNGLVAEGKCKGGNPLGEGGKIVSGKSATVSDGPFAEAKEAIAGYFYLEVESEEEAVAIAQRCPALPYGLQVEVRPVIPSCAAMDFVKDAAVAVGV